MTARDERVAMTSFLAGGLLAGGNAVCIRYSNRELAPYWGAGLRFVLAAAVSLALVALFRIGLPRGRALRGAALYGLFQFGGSFGLAYYALVRIHAGLGQTLLALVPLATLLVAVAQRQERLRVAAAVGAVVAVGGVAVMSRASVAGSLPPLSLLAILGSVFCFAEAAVLVRRLPAVQPFAMNAVGMTSAALLLVVIAAIKREPFAIPRRMETWIAIGYIVAIGSVVVFALALLVLRYWEASRYAYLFVIVPPVTIAVSAWLLDEPVGWPLVLGGLLILAGVYIGALRPARLAART